MAGKTVFYIGVRMSSLVWQDDCVALHCGDALEVMSGLPDGSIDLIVTDPPYFQVKDEWWDRQWDDAATFLDWLGQLCEQWRRILSPNGSLYVFASPQLAARVECRIAQTFNVLNSIVWLKLDAGGGLTGQHNKAHKEDLRRFFPQTERIVFAEHYGADGYAAGSSGWAAKCGELRGFVFEPLRAYLAGEWQRAGLLSQQADEALGTNGMAGHYFGRSQWMLPTREAYEKLRAYANARNHGGEYLRRDYEELRRDYEELRRPFFATADAPYTDVWDFRVVQDFPGKHPAEKPLALMEHIIRVSSRPGAMVFDCCVGRGTTLVAARNLGRKALGCDVMSRWCEAAAARLVQASFLPLIEQAGIGDGERSG